MYVNPMGRYRRQIAEAYNHLSLIINDQAHWTPEQLEDLRVAHDALKHVLHPEMARRAPFSLAQLQQANTGDNSQYAPGAGDKV